MYSEDLRKVLCMQERDALEVLESLLFMVMGGAYFAHYWLPKRDGRRAAYRVLCREAA